MLRIDLPCLGVLSLWIHSFTHSGGDILWQWQQNPFSGPLHHYSVCIVPHRNTIAYTKYTPFTRFLNSVNDFLRIFSFVFNSFFFKFSVFFLWFLGVYDLFFMSFISFFTLFLSVSFSLFDVFLPLSHLLSFSSHKSVAYNLRNWIIFHFLAKPFFFLSLLKKSHRILFTHRIQWIFRANENLFVFALSFEALK